METQSPPKQSINPTVKKWLIGIGIAFGLLFAYLVYQWIQVNNSWNDLSSSEQQDVCWAVDNYPEVIDELADEELNPLQHWVWDAFIDAECD